MGGGGREKKREEVRVRREWGAEDLNWRAKETAGEMGGGVAGLAAFLPFLPFFLGGSGRTESGTLTFVQSKKLGSELGEIRYELEVRVCGLGVILLSLT